MPKYLVEFNSAIRGRLEIEVEEEGVVEAAETAYQQVDRLNKVGKIGGRDDWFLSRVTERGATDHSQKMCKYP